MFNDTYGIDFGNATGMAQGGVFDLQETMKFGARYPTFDVGRWLFRVLYFTLVGRM